MHLRISPGNCRPSPRLLDRSEKCPGAFSGTYITPFSASYLTEPSFNRCNRIPSSPRVDCSELRRFRDVPVHSHTDQRESAVPPSGENPGKRLDGEKEKRCLYGLQDKKGDEREGKSGEMLNEGDA